MEFPDWHQVIGIDLGTTYSVVAAYDLSARRPRILRNPDEANSTTTPSVVGYNRLLQKVLVGSAAKRGLFDDPHSAIVEVKRHMGQVFDPASLDRFKATNRSRPNDPISLILADDCVSPQEISALILMKMKHIAEVAIGKEIHDAVITVPGYFTEQQKRATAEAAFLAGLYPRQLVPEPTATAICYGIDRAVEGRELHLVFDLGGGTLDVSIIEVECGNVAVISTSGDLRLGGSDFDDAITDWAVQEIQRKHNMDVSADAVARMRIRLAAEETKIALSTQDSANLILGKTAGREALVLTLERAVFEQLIGPALGRALACVERVIADALNKGIGKDQIDTVLLVGNSSKIPKIKSVLSAGVRD